MTMELSNDEKSLHFGRNLNQDLFYLDRWLNSSSVTAAVSLDMLDITHHK